jgi:hypothetical protein
MPVISSMLLLSKHNFINESNPIKFSILIIFLKDNVNDFAVGAINDIIMIIMLYDII